MSRRSLIALGAVALTGAPLVGACSPATLDATGSVPTTGPSKAGPTSPDTLRQPAVQRSESGVLRTTLTAAAGTVDIGAPQPISTWAYNGVVPGPTWEIHPGDVLRVELVNELPPIDGEGQKDHSDHTDATVVGPTGATMQSGLDSTAVGRPEGGKASAGDAPMDRPHAWNTTNLHYHGMHVSPEGNGDDVFLTVEPGQRHHYEIEVPTNHPGGLFWYHPHRHGGVAQQIRGGMAGAIVVRGAIDGVPEVAAAAEQLMVIQAIEVDENYTVAAPIPDPTSSEAFFPRSQILYPINGGVTPTLSMRPGEVVRWRILNAAEGKFLNLTADGLELHAIAWDGLTLGSAEKVPNLFLSAGNRVDVLVRAGSPGTVQLQCTPSSSQKPGTQGVPGPTDGLPPELVTRAIATIVVAGDPVMMELPSALPAWEQDIRPIARTREVVYTVERSGDRFKEFGINGHEFTAAIPPYVVKLGTAEEWTIINGLDGKFAEHAHVFHIHVNPFKITRINGQVLDTPLWRDTYVLTGADGDSFTMQTNFLDFTGSFVDHCHIVSHEDLGMMETIQVVS